MKINDKNIHLEYTNHSSHKSDNFALTTEVHDNNHGHLGALSFSESANHIGNTSVKLLGGALGEVLTDFN